MPDLPEIIPGIGITNGIPESIIAILIVTAVVSALKTKCAAPQK